MAMLFKGSGVVWIPAKHRSIRFVGGEYATDDADEIAVLSRNYESIPAKVESVNIPDEVKPEADKPKRGRKPNAERDY